MLSLFTELRTFVRLVMLITYCFMSDTNFQCAMVNRLGFSDVLMIHNINLHQDFAHLCY